jgi:hypothetical protein
MLFSHFTNKAGNDKNELRIERQAKEIRSLEIRRQIIEELKDAQNP